MISGCATGYGTGYTSMAVGATSENSTLLSQRQARLSTAFHEFRLVDSTGLLMAAAANTARHHLARQQAIENARFKQPNDDGTVDIEYSYKPMPVVGGALTDLRVRLAAGGVSTSFPGWEDEIEVLGTTYFGFDLRTELYNFAIGELPLMAAITGTAAMEWWGVQLGTRQTDMSDAALDYYAGGSLTYLISPDMIAAARLDVGLFVPVVGYLVSIDGPKFTPRAEVEFNYRPHPLVQVGATAGFSRLGTMSRGFTGPRIGLTAALLFGGPESSI